MLSPCFFVLMTCKQTNKKKPQWTPLTNITLVLISKVFSYLERMSWFPQKMFLSGVHCATKKNALYLVR